MAIAKEIMTDKVVTLPAATDITEAVEVFTTKKITSMPVTMVTGEIAGQLTEFVLVRLMVMHQAQPEKFKKLAHALEHLEQPVFVEPQDSVAVVLKAMMSSPIKRVIVSMDKCRVLGIISPKDLLRALAAGDKTAQVIQKEVQKTTAAGAAMKAG
ncbi:HPP family protein [Bdellovibrio sp. HCB337]|uniref:CBS domain-containing protein n=1 Tax=Bdellovibrio sp. HCB337 TaxID=3394358 RepID=UPI0039A66ADD